MISGGNRTDRHLDGQQAIIAAGGHHLISEIVIDFLSHYYEDKKRGIFAFSASGAWGDVILLDQASSVLGNLIDGSDFQVRIVRAPSRFPALAPY